MAKRMLIDASHLEETRVVVLSGNRLEEFDYESASKTQLKGNIYLAKVTRVEPSLQAAFVDYGGNRHGFLPFSEIHPDYYRIPVADREALIAEEAAFKAEAAEEEVDGEPAEGPEIDLRESAPAAQTGGPGARHSRAEAEADEPNGELEEVSSETSVDTVGGDEVDDAARRRARLLRKYKIQEVIKRRQVILVQVTKEERGSKGAALTTYLSLAGRYCVLMPNTGSGGGISRKISNAADRRRLKRILESLDIPEGVAVIVRTAGSERTKAEIRRDYEYLLRLWSEIRETTLASSAPCLIHEEANLIKRAIRDLYQSNMDEILVDGEDGYKLAKSFMKSLMPSHARRVKLYKTDAIPLFYRYQVESQIDAMHNATVQLKSGGYIVINLTEALVAIDVNSGKATRERHIEETAYKTNLEAAEEIARQLRLRDLAGLIVIDFIDMEESRHNRGVERKLKESMRLDRARIQLGRLSPFGLLEMSRQRLRPSLFESSTVVCPNCNASGYVRTIESVALHVLRGLEEEGIRRGAGELVVSAPPQAALHLLNQMRGRVAETEQRYGFRVRIEPDETLIPPDYTLTRLSQTRRAVAAEEGEGEKAEGRRARGRGRRRKADEPAQPEAAGTAPEEGAEEAEELAAEGAEDADEDKPKRRRRRGKRGGRRRARRRAEEAAEAGDLGLVPEAEAEARDAGEAAEADEAAPEPSAEVKPKRRRGTRKKKAAAEPAEEAAEEAAETPAEAGPAADNGDAEPEAQDTAKRRRRAGAAKKPARKRAARKTKPAAEAAAQEPKTAPCEGPEQTPAAEPLGAAVPQGPAGNGADSSAAVGGEAAAVEEAEAPRRRGWWQRWGG